MQGIYQLSGRFRRLLSGGLLTDLEESREFSRTIGMVDMDLQIVFECLSNPYEEKEE